MNAPVVMQNRPIIMASETFHTRLLNRLCWAALVIAALALVGLLTLGTN